ncbi:MAG: hypothetical protein V4844_12090 [Pseudomonadota bacterium]
MGKDKNAWRDERGRHVRLYVRDFLRSPSWLATSVHARVAYVQMRALLGQANNGDISFTIKQARDCRAFKSETTLAAALAELRVLGFIRVTRQGCVSKGSRLPTLYAFTDVEVYECTKEGGFKFGPWAPLYKTGHRLFGSIQDAEVALEAGLLELKAEARRRNGTTAKEKNSTLQSAKPHAPKTSPDLALNASKAQPDLPSKASFRGVLLQMPGRGRGGKSGRRRDTHHEFPDGACLARAICATPCSGCRALAGELHLASCKVEPCAKCGAPRAKCACHGRSPVYAQTVRSRAGRSPATS